MCSKTWHPIVCKSLENILEDVIHAVISSGSLQVAHNQPESSFYNVFPVCSLGFWIASWLAIVDRPIHQIPGARGDGGEEKEVEGIGEKEGGMEERLEHQLYQCHEELTKSPSKSSYNTCNKNMFLTSMTAALILSRLWDKLVGMWRIEGKRLSDRAMGSDTIVPFYNILSFPLLCFIVHLHRNNVQE